MMDRPEERKQSYKINRYFLTWFIHFKKLPISWMSVASNTGDFFSFPIQKPESLICIIYTSYVALPHAHSQHGWAWIVILIYSKNEYQTLQSHRVKNTKF